jgi:DNA mismatch repair protein MutS2
VLLADIEAREALLTDRERVTSIEQEKLRARLATVSDRELKVRERERESEREARREARRYLLEARNEVERAIAAVRAEAAAESEAFEAAARASRRAIEEAAALQGAAVDQVEVRAKRDRERAASRRGEASVAKTAAEGRVRAEERTIAEGDTVFVTTLGDKSGRVVSVKGTEARVIVGSMTVTVPLNTLRRAATPPPPAVKLSLQGELPEAEPLREIDLRGLRVDEVDDHVMQALDAAVRNDMRELRIIHGKGTGALRARVGEMLKKDTRVTGFRLGAWNEGGAGVTVAVLS